MEFRRAKAEILTTRHLKALLYAEREEPIEITQQTIAYERAAQKEYV